MMEGFKGFSAIFLVAFLLLFRPVQSQTSSFCSSSMLQSFTPCISYLSNGSGGSPTAACCDSLKSFMSSGRDCLCLILTGGVAFQIPLNRTLAASLPRACKTSGVPVECKALPASPIPAPGPAILNPSPPSWLPDPNPPPGNDGTVTPPGFPTPGSGSGAGAGAGGDGTLTPPGSTDGFLPMTPPGIRPDLSAAEPSPRFSLLSLIALFGAIAFKYF